MMTDLNANGFTLIRELMPGTSTLEVAAALGNVIEIEKVLPGGRIPTVQRLRPHDTNDAGPNQYSGNYGFGEFPLHSDLAHWTIPPRYFLLRCIEGTGDVYTRILPGAGIVASLGLPSLRRALFAGRKRKLGCSGLVRAISPHEAGDIFRWDPVFLRPLNAHAQELAVFMKNPRWNEHKAQILLSRPGDTVLIDNWRTLHGRSPVPAASAGRLLERVYLSEILP